ncbi:MAG TPA: UPF0149 family protein [Gammaproteobacteria bacterium]|nr:UPF0149 family protein [Gammaproteobacteria bacterium]
MDFEQLQTVLSRAEAASGAAESHGTLCGVICSGSQQPDSAWLSQVLGDSSENASTRECHAALTALEDTVRRQLAAFDMDFTPLLPDDEEPLAQRVEALGLWCQGFLFGLSLGRTRAELDALSGEAGEVIHDLAEIARAGVESGGSDDEADEQAYAELVEYLRVAVQILYEALNPGATPPSDPDQPVTLH